MSSWIDYLPRRGEERAVTEQAVRKTAPPTTPFADLAAEAMRLVVLLGRGDEVIGRHRERLVRALAELSSEQPEPHVAGVLAFANVAAMHRAAERRDVTDTVLSGLAARGVRSRPLAYAALAAGQADRAIAFSDDPVVASLARGDAAAFTQVVAAFPESDLGYGELGFVARGYIELVEPHLRAEATRAAAWVHRTVHEGPQPVDRPRIRAPVPEVAPTWIALHEIHGLWGGTAIDVSPEGRVTVITRPAGGDYEVQRRSLTVGERSELERALAAEDPRRIVIPQRSGVPDETSSSITYVADGVATRLWKWQSDPHPSFDALARILRSLGRST